MKVNDLLWVYAAIIQTGGAQNPSERNEEKSSIPAGDRTPPSPSMVGYLIWHALLRLLIVNSPTALR
jgi:hypothetical protein